MNNGRRKLLTEIAHKLSVLQVDLDGIREAEEEYFETMPEPIQGSAKGERAQEAAEQLSTAVGDLDAVIENINSAME